MRILGRPLTDYDSQMARWRSLSDQTGFCKSEEYISYPRFLAGRR